MVGNCFEVGKVRADVGAGARARGIGGSKNFDWRLLIWGIDEFSSENGGEKKGKWLKKIKFGEFKNLNSNFQVNVMEK